MKHPFRHEREPNTTKIRMQSGGRCPRGGWAANAVSAGLSAGRFPHRRRRGTRRSAVAL